MVSRADVYKVKSAIVVAVERWLFVIKTIVTPRALNSFITSTMSNVVPLCDTATRTSPLFNREIDVNAECASRHAIAGLPNRFNFSCRSIATYPDDARPIIPTVRALPHAFTTFLNVATSKRSAVD